VLAGTQIPAGPGLSTVLPDFDFETYSEAGYRWVPELQKWKSLEGIPKTRRGIGVVGAANYVEHASFRVLSLAYNLKDGRGPRHWKPGDRDPLDLFEHITHGGLLEAWNVGFERRVWESYCVPKLGWPAIPPEQLRCAMAKSRAFGMPGALENAGNVLQIEHKKDPEGKRLIQKLTVPRNPTKGNPELHWTPETAPEDFSKFYRYNETDIVAESEASAKLPDLTPHEFEIWQADQRINFRGMQIDLVAVENCIAILEQAEAKYNAELCQITNGAVSESTEVAKLVAWIQSQGVTIFDLNEETVSALLKEPPYSAAVTRALQIRQALGFASVKKLYAFRAMSTTDGRLYDQYAYYAAHTALWNAQGVQVSNLYKGRFNTPEAVEAALACIACRCLELVEYEYGDALECVASCLRSLIIAKPDHELICSDYTAIQAVVTAALAGETWRLEVFRTHGMIYEMCASQITRVPFEEFIKYRERTGGTIHYDASGKFSHVTGGKHHPHRQPYGKIPELASGFGGWIGAWLKFGAGEFLDEDAIKRAILAWREASPMIVELWGGQTRDKFQPSERPELYGLEGAAIAAVQNPGMAYEYRGIAFQTHGDVLYCRPPSGGLITYHEPRLTQATRPYAAPWELALSYMGWNSNATKGPPGWLRMDLYGGVLTQNVVSHMSREVQAGAIVRLENAGYPIVMHTHDEDVAEVPLGMGSVAEFERLMTPPEPWAAGWPIAPKGGWRGSRYGKWE
jgi:DNA polymerase bacteriophage-type